MSDEPIQPLALTVEQAAKLLGDRSSHRSRRDHLRTLGDGDGIIFWLSDHEHMFPADAPSDRPWTTLAVGAIAELLCGKYVVEDHSRGKRPVKIRIIDVRDPAGERVMETIGTPLALLPWPGPKRVERRRIDFGAHRQSAAGVG